MSNTSVRPLTRPTVLKRFVKRTNVSLTTAERTRPGTEDADLHLPSGGLCMHGERRERQAKSEHQDDPPHDHLGLGWLAGV